MSDDYQPTFIYQVLDETAQTTLVATSKDDFGELLQLLAASADAIKPLVDEGHLVIIRRTSTGRQPAPDS